MKLLAFRLRDNVEVREHNRRLLLVLSYPLKTVSLHPFWRELFALLSKDAFTPFESLRRAAGLADAAQCESFLMDLARRGFLERQGVAEMYPLPSVSIIIPVRNRPEDIGMCLRSLTTLDYPKEKLEIIVVDDASTDRTPEVVSHFPVRLIRNERNLRQSFSRNRAARTASGEILAFIDSDCLASPLWLRELVPAFRDTALGAVGGKVDAFYEKTGLDRYEKVKSSLIMGNRPQRSQPDDPFFYVPSCNLLIRRNLFLDLGGFNEALDVGEDVDLCLRVRKRSSEIEYRTAGAVYHKHRNELLPFCRRRFEYGTSEPLLQQLHRERVKCLIVPPSKWLFCLFALLAITTGQAGWIGGCALSILTEYLRTVFRFRGLPIAKGVIAGSVARSYPAFLYHLSAFTSRYYLVAVPVIALISPEGAMAVFAVHLAVGLVEFHLKRPDLNVFVFLVYFTLEQISYQLGVWFGCLRYQCLMPVNPRIAGTPPEGPKTFPPSAIRETAA